MEYMPYGDLDQAVKSPLQEPEARQIIFQTVEGVSFMHGSGFAHRDLKPSVSISLGPLSKQSGHRLTN